MPNEPKKLPNEFKKMPNEFKEKKGKIMEIRQDPKIKLKPPKRRRFCSYTPGAGISLLALPSTIR